VQTNLRFCTQCLNFERLLMPKFQRFLLCKALTVVETCSCKPGRFVSLPSLTEERGVIPSIFTVYDKWQAVGVSNIAFPVGISSCVFIYQVILRDVCVSFIACFISGNVGRPLSARNLRFNICVDEKCLYFTQANNILRKNPNIALIYVNTIFTVAPCMLFRLFL
jgi:hypothetical protein